MVDRWSDDSDDDWPGDEFQARQSDAESWSDDARFQDDGADDDAAETIPCPHCGEEVYEDAPRCPHCQRYITDEDAPPRRKPWWIIAGTLACFWVAWRWVFG